MTNEVLLSEPAPARLAFPKVTTHLVGLDFPSSNTHILCRRKSHSPGQTGRTAAAAGMPSSPQFLRPHLPMLNPTLEAHCRCHISIPGNLSHFPPLSWEPLGCQSTLSLRSFTAPCKSNICTSLSSVNPWRQGLLSYSSPRWLSGSLIWDGYSSSGAASRSQPLRGRKKAPVFTTVFHYVPFHHVWM